MMFSRAVALFALFATIEYAGAEDLANRRLAFSGSPVAAPMNAPSVSKSAPTVTGLLQDVANPSPKALVQDPAAGLAQAPGFERPLSDAQNIVTQSQVTETKSNLRAQKQHIHEQTFDGFLMGSVAFLGLAVSMGIAAVRKFAWNRQPASEPGSKAGISMLQIPENVAPAQVAAGVTAAVIATASPVQPAFAVNAEMDPATGMVNESRIALERKLTSESNNETFERRVREDQVLQVPGLIFVAANFYVFAQWASYQEDDVDFFDTYDSRRVDLLSNDPYDKPKAKKASARGGKKGGKPGKRSSRVRMSALLKKTIKQNVPIKKTGVAKGIRSVPAKMSATEDPTARREFLTKTLGASALFAATAANAVIDYAGVGYLGGQKTVDVNNANVRVYTKKQGMYPGAAGKIVSHVPYTDLKDMYAKANFTAQEKEVVKQYEKDFVFLEPRPEFVIDNINNGLYR